MYCPKCRTEYRPGFTRCSDCHADLVHDLPAEKQEEKESAPLWPDAESLSELWRGEDTGLHGRLVGELKQAGIPYETQPTREAAGCGIDPVARGVEPRFGFIVRVQPKDRAAAWGKLFNLLNAEKVDFSIPVDASAAYRSLQNSRTAGLLTPAEAEVGEARELKCVWEGNDVAKRDFVRASLREHGIASDSSLQGQSYRIFVDEAVQPMAVETIKQIVEGAPPSFETGDSESRDKASFLKPQLLLYSILTAVILYVAVPILLTFFAGNPVVAQLPAILGTCAVLGAVWTVYQAVRYEDRPGLYLLMAIIPFSFVWYYFGRYKTRTSEVTGPSFGQPPG
jgi:hypothetical protein